MASQTETTMPPQTDSVETEVKQQAEKSFPFVLVYGSYFFIGIILLFLAAWLISQ